MVIKASSSKQIDALIVQLGSTTEATREAAIARFAVIGTRAVPRLVALADDPASGLAARAAAYRALELIPDRRGLDAALRALADPDPIVVVSAVGVASTFLSGSESVRAVDGLTALALDRRRPDAGRLAAVRALAALDPATIQPILRALNSDPNPTLAGVAASAEAAERPRTP